MDKTYFIADTHFGDSAILRYENRPFENVSHMDNELISRWNSVVSDDDRVYVLGDFGAEGYETEVISALKGKKYLIKGNHDVKSNDYYRKAGFEEVYDHPIILDNFWILSHDAVYVNINMPYANLFGHVHNSPVVKDYSDQHFCVSVERIDYAPVCFERVKEVVKEKVSR